jgi:hypothetical protein
VNTIVVNLPVPLSFYNAESKGTGRVRSHKNKSDHFYIYKNGFLFTIKSKGCFFFCCFLPKVGYLRLAEGSLPSAKKQKKYLRLKKKVDNAASCVIFGFSFMFSITFLRKSNVKT